MGDTTKRFKHELLQDAKSIKSLLAALSKGIGKGELVLGDDEDEITLQPEGLLSVRLKAEREGGQSQITLRVSWADREKPAKSKGTPRIES